MKFSALVLALGLAATDAFAPATTNNNRATQLFMDPGQGGHLIQTTGGLEVSSKMVDLSPGEVLALASARARATINAPSLSPENLAPPGPWYEKKGTENLPSISRSYPSVFRGSPGLIQTTGGTEVSSKMSDLSPAELLAMASAKTTGAISAPYLSPENLAPPGIGQEKQGLQPPRMPREYNAPQLPEQVAMEAPPAMMPPQSMPAPVAYQYTGGAR